jgi:hypothetical protein
MTPDRRFGVHVCCAYALPGDAQNAQFCAVGNPPVCGTQEAR